MSGIDTDPESTVAIAQDLPDTEPDDAPAATEDAAEAPTDSETEPPTVTEAPADSASEAPDVTEAPAESQTPTEIPTETPTETPAESSAGPQDSATQRTGRLSPKARRLLPVALAVLVIASAGAVGLLGWQAIRAGDAEQNAAEAMDAARTSTSQVLSYESKTLDADLARARAQLSGTFAAQFEQTATNVIVPASRKEDIASKTEVIRSAVIDAQQNRAEVLLYLSQTASTSSQPEPQRGIVQVKVTMTRAADGQWLISDVQSL